MAEIASWIRHVAPSVFIVDESVEVAMLVRLHGIPVVTVAGPGERGDAAHRLGFDVSDAIIGCWPPEAAGMCVAYLRRCWTGCTPSEPSPGSRSPSLGRDDRVRAGWRCSPVPAVTRSSGGPRVARKETPQWDWTVLDPELGSWVDAPYDALLDADVVVTHAGQNALAEVAASRTPAVVVPRPRPHHEQEVTAEVLWHGGWPAVVIDAWPRQGWAERLEHADLLDGRTGPLVRRPCGRAHRRRGSVGRAGGPGELGTARSGELRQHAECSTT